MIEVPLLKRDLDLILKFQAWCSLKGLERFSADDFRNYLDDLRKELPDPVHDYGGIFRAIIVTGLATEVDWIRSTYPPNRKRKIRLYEWTNK